MRAFAVSLPILKDQYYIFILENFLNIFKKWKTMILSVEDQLAWD